MRPRSLPWLALHLFAIVVGIVSLVGAVGTPSAALQTSYGQGYLAGRLIWTFVAMFAVKKLLDEYSGSGRDGRTTTAAGANPAYVPTTRPRSAFECEAFGTTAPAYGAAGYLEPAAQPMPAAFYAPPSQPSQTAYPAPPAFGPGSSYVESASRFASLPPTHAAAPALRGSVAPPGR